MEKVLIAIAAIAAIVFFVSLFVDRKPAAPVPGEAEQVLDEAYDDWSEQDEDDFAEYFGEFGEF